jgi:CheY-like chemotaxis protein
MSETQPKLLIVDDEPAIRTSISHVLAEVGYHARVAEDGFSALREIRRQMPDILLSDLNMPGMSGFELLSVVRRRFPAIQAIAMSGAFCGDEVPSGIAADAFYQKGSSIGALLQILNAVPHMERRAPRPSGAAVPLWIHPNRQDLPDEVGVTIACPECLRTFRQPAGSSICRIHETECIYCRTSIQYAIVEPGMRQPFEVHRQTPGESKPWPATTAQFYY